MIVFQHIWWNYKLDDISEMLAQIHRKYSLSLNPFIIPDLARDLVDIKAGIEPYRSIYDTYVKAEATRLNWG